LIKQWGTREKGTIHGLKGMAVINHRAPNSCREKCVENGFHIPEKEGGRKKTKKKGAAVLWHPGKRAKGRDENEHGLIKPSNQGRGRGVGRKG